MVDTTLRAGISRRSSERLSARTYIGRASFAVDLVALIGAYLAAEAMRALTLSTVGLADAEFAPDWSVFVFTVLTLSVFYASGLYEPEAYVSRPLHVWTLAKATSIAFVISSLAVFAIRADAVQVSRITLVATFVLFFAISFALRLGVLDWFAGAWVSKRRPVSILVGDNSDAMRTLSERLGQLRGFDQVAQLAPSELAQNPAESLRTVLDGDTRAASVFIDATSMNPREVFGAAAAGRSVGAEVYLVSWHFEALQGNRLLGKLFHVPATRLRRSIECVKPYPLKRALDIVGSGILLLVSAPLMFVLGIIIRLTSPGPVFYKQTRVGRFGVPFEFLKLRSMVTDGDECIHSEYVRAFMNGTAEAVPNGRDGEAIFKKVDDPRITPVGRFVRKYSLDEIPQFWNVFRGDMSLVGPRPPLPYEVNEYDEWDSLRLSVPAGITGLWQVAGRSRVSFDEMVLQDLMYAQNMRLLVDIVLCLRTLPATLVGGGGG